MTKKIFENYFKQNLKEHAAAMASTGEAGGGTRNSPHENKYIRGMVSKLTNKNWVTQWLRFMIRTLVDDKGMRGIEQAIGAGVKVKWSANLETDYFDGEPAGLARKRKPIGKYDSDVGLFFDKPQLKRLLNMHGSLVGTVFINLNLMPRFVDEKLEELATRLAGSPEQGYQGHLDPYTEAMMRIRDFREVVFQMVAFESTVKALDVLMHELSHIAYQPKIDGSEYLNVPRFNKDGEYRGGSWSAEITATNHTITCLKQIAKNMSKESARMINLLKKNRITKQVNPELIISYFDNINMLIQHQIRGEQAYAAKAFKVAKVGGLHPTRDTEFDPENLPYPIDKDGNFKAPPEKMMEPVGGMMPDKFINVPGKSAADKLYSCRDLLEVEEEVKDTIHNKTIREMQLEMGPRPLTTSTKAAYKKRISDLKNLKYRLKTSEEFSGDIKGYPEYIDCLFEKQFGNLKEQTNVNKTLQEYILKNTSEKFEETPFGQIVVDEINKAVAEIPEIKIALEYLAEQEDAELEANTKELGKSYATAALNKVREDMIEKLPQMVEDILASIMSEMETSE